MKAASFKKIMKKSAEVVIIGGGVMGCSILFHLAKLGIRDALLVEQEVIGWGSSSRGNSILRTHYSNPVTTLLAKESLEAFTNIADVAGDDCGFSRIGWLLAAGKSDSDAVMKNVKMQQGLGVRTSVVSESDVLEIAPGIEISEGDIFAYEPDAGTANPYRVTASYAKAATSLGADIQTGVTVTGINLGPDQKVRSVRTSEGVIETDAAVIATGPWSGSVFESLGLKSPFVPIRHAVIALREAANMPQGLPTINDIPNSFSARPEGGIWLVGVGEEELANPDNYDQGVNEDWAARTLRSVSLRLPLMSKASFVGGWSGLFTTTPDWHPVLGQIEGYAGLFCATGFSGHGFKLSPMIGRSIAELIHSGKTNSIDITHLAFSRFENNNHLQSSYRMRVLA